MHSSSMILALIAAVAALPQDQVLPKRESRFSCSVYGHDEMTQSQTPIRRRDTIDTYDTDTNWAVSMVDKQNPEFSLQWWPKGDTSSPIYPGGQTFTKEDTGFIDSDIFYQGMGGSSFTGCQCSINGVTGPLAKTDYELYDIPFFQKESNSCVCSVDCNPPVMSKGWCGVHVSQRQKPDPSKDSYTVIVSVFDSKKALAAKKVATAPTGVHVHIPTLLGLDFEVIAGPVDASPLGFSYDYNDWDSSSKSCSVGAYDSGAREMDCIFPC